MDELEEEGDEREYFQKKVRKGNSRYKIVNVKSENKIDNNLFKYFKIFFIVIVSILFLFFIYYAIYSNPTGKRRKIGKEFNLNDYKDESGVVNLGNQKNINDIYNKENNNFVHYDQRKNVKFTNLNMSEFENNINLSSNVNETEQNGTKRKLGVALIYSTLFSNGIARFLQVTGNYLAETGRYNVYFITGKPYHKEYKFHKDIKRFVGENNNTVIRSISKHFKIDIFILHNVIGNSAVNFYRSLGAKVIGMFHGNFMSGMFLNDGTNYKHWHYFDYFDAFVFIGSDDYYFYNKLQFKNHIFIPNLYTFEPSQVQSSNLTTHNLIMLGRQNDKIKGAIYAIKAMSLIVKEVPDAVLYLITSDSRVDFIKSLIRELKLSKSIKIVYHTYNITEYFHNSSVHLYPSLSEAFPMAMNEGKAHGMPIVAFDVPISNPYQSGVITVDSQDYVALARESIKLLKDINYRRRMGELSKLSLNMFKNNETVRTWERLFDALIDDKDDKKKFHDLQKEIQDKYYNEEKAIIHIKKHFKDVKKYNSNLSCFTLENFTNLQYIKNISKCKFLDDAVNTTNEIKKNGTNRKLGVALIYSTLFSNGIARFLQVTGNYLAETGRYNVYFITGKPYHKEYKFHKDIKRFVGENNNTVIRSISKHFKIDIFILHNVIGNSAVNFYRSLGAKVIGMFHGNFMSGMFLNDGTNYKHWHYFDYFDAFVFIGSDDYYFYNKLQFKNHIFIPNLYTFEPSQVQSSNLTTHNLIMLGRQNDKIKGAIYAIKAMSLIVKEVPDAVLYLITSDSRVDFIKSLIRELKLSKSIKIVYHTYNITEYFHNSSVHLYPSLSEAFPMAMNEGKAHGMPIVAFDVPISNPYQSGVITVDSQDYVALARESIKLLKDINYRRRMGELSKLSLNMFKNNETVRTWERLFDALIDDKDDKKKFHDLQKEIQDKYYNEERAIIHIEKHFRDAKRYNPNITCFSLENFTNLQYIKNISKCKILNDTINNTNNITTNSNRI